MPQLSTVAYSFISLFLVSCMLFSSTRNKGGVWLCKLGLDVNTNIDK